MILGKINYPLPDDIDLTEDEVFRERTRFIPFGKGNELPWEKINTNYLTISDNSFIRTIRVNTSLDDWVNTTTESINIEEDFREDINSDMLSRIAQITYSPDGYTTTITTNSTNNIYKTYFTSTTHNYSKFKYQDDVVESEKFKEFKSLYKDLPFSPVFKGKEKEYVNPLCEIITSVTPLRLDSDFANSSSVSSSSADVGSSIKITSASCTTARAITTNCL